MFLNISVIQTFMIDFLEYAVFDLVVWQEEEKNEENNREGEKKNACAPQH